MRCRLAFAILLTTCMSSALGKEGEGAPSVVSEGLAQSTAACISCHRTKAGSPASFVPKIAGKPAEYLEQQLLHFRDGRRRHVGMAMLLEGLSNTYIREIATYFASEPALADMHTPQSQLRPAESERARLLASRGILEANLPACASCHGARLSGTPPRVPPLLGMPADYIASQLGAWRTGTRTSQSPDCMAAIARKLSDTDVALMARWLSTQPANGLDPVLENVPMTHVKCAGVSQ